MLGLPENAPARRPGLLHRECIDAASQSEEDRAQLALVLSLPLVSGCHRCAGDEIPYFTFTLTWKSWLCRTCVREIHEAEGGDKSLFDYLRHAILERAE